MRERGIPVISQHTADGFCPNIFYLFFFITVAVINSIASYCDLRFYRANAVATAPVFDDEISAMCCLTHGVDNRSRIVRRTQSRMDYLELKHKYVACLLDSFLKHLRASSISSVEATSWKIRAIGLKHFYFTAGGSKVPCHLILYDDQYCHGLRKL